MRFCHFSIAPGEYAPYIEVAHDHLNFESGPVGVRSFCFDRRTFGTSASASRSLRDHHKVPKGHRPVLVMTSVSSTDPHQRFIIETGLAAEIADLVEPRIVALGFRLVRVSVTGRNGSTIQIMAERPDGRITIGEIEQISRDISPAIDVLDPMSGKYHLEISSPGIDRPLVRASDFETWAGQEVRIELKETIDGQRRLRGRLEGFVDGEVRIEVSDIPGAVGPTVVGLQPALIAAARLVMTDELIREDLRRSAKEHDLDAEPHAEGEEE